ncbi:MAG TPA: phosphotransferase [Anaerolineales bacterium]|nr:phosphotransferase [Anaerolineales bacterium]
MQNRREHEQEMRSFLQKHMSTHDVTVSLPAGSGMETYVVRAGEQAYFVKVGADVERYLIMAEIGLTPPVLAFGKLERGSSIIVQRLINARMPSKRDYQDQFEKVAQRIHTMHNHPRLRMMLPAPLSSLHRDAGMQVLTQLRHRWERYKAEVPSVADFVDSSLEHLAGQISQFSTAGLVVSHNDICNANWLFDSDGNIYLVDFDSMSLDDPALDLGALLWWYYPPELRAQFLDIAGYTYDDEFKFRMQVRMSMHCLHITLPREQSFDRFDPLHYEERLEDFKASLAGKENPQGYDG